MYNMNNLKGEIKMKERIELIVKSAQENGKNGFQSHCIADGTEASITVLIFVVLFMALGGKVLVDDIVLLEIGTFASYACLSLVKSYVAYEGEGKIKALLPSLAIVTAVIMSTWIGNVLSVVGKVF
jgi:hypothetical protein